MGDKWTLTAPREHRRNVRYLKSNPTKHDSLCKTWKTAKKAHTHVTHPSRIVKAVAAKFFFSYFKRFSSTTSFEEKVRIVNNLSDSLTDDKRKYSRNFLARIGLSSSIRFSMYPKNMSSLLVLHHWNCFDHQKSIISNNHLKIEFAESAI